MLAVIGVSQGAGILLWQGIFWGKASAASLLPVHELLTFFFTAVKTFCSIDIKLCYGVCEGIFHAVILKVLGKCWIFNLLCKHVLTDNLKCTL